MAKPPLWTCPKCGERFVIATPYHSRGRYSYEAHFANTKSPVLKKAYKIGCQE